MNQHARLPTAVLFLLLCLPLAAVCDDYSNRYDLSRETPALDLGVQPLGYPAAMIGAVLRHDRILKRRLDELGCPFATFPFRRGPDMLDLLADGRLEAGLLGDMPTIMLSMRTDVLIGGLAKRSATAVVTRDPGVLASMQGKRFAYVPGSSAHYTLLQALASVGLGEQSVTLVELAVDEMPAALEQARVDAFAAWEPAPSLALAHNPSARVVFRGTSSDYLVLTRRFVESKPEAARHLVAAFARSLEWMRQSRTNVETAARWAMADGAAFGGRAVDLTLAQAVAITRRELLDVPAAPALPDRNRDQEPLIGEFDFLQRIGKLPAGSRRERVAAAFTYDGLRQVYANPARYQPYSFDYER